MALDPAVLAALIVMKVEASTGNEMPALSATVWRSIAEAIIEHFTSAGVITVTSVSGVTTGGGVSGPGTGTIS